MQERFRLGYDNPSSPYHPLHHPNSHCPERSWQPQRQTVSRSQEAFEQKMQVPRRLREASAAIPNQRALHPRAILILFLVPLLIVLKLRRS